MPLSPHMSSSAGLLVSSTFKSLQQSLVRTVERAKSSDRKAFSYKTDERDEWKVIKTSLGQIRNLPTVSPELMAGSTVWAKLGLLWLPQGDMGPRNPDDPTQDSDQHPH